MCNLTVLYNSEKEVERLKAIATARMIYYAAKDASDIDLGECSQLLYFVADVIRMKFKIQDDEALLDRDDRIKFNNRSKQEPIPPS